MNPRSDRSGRLPDVVIELDDPAELYSVDPRDLLNGSNRIDSGIEELVERLLAQRRTTNEQRIVLDIAGECSDEEATKLVKSVRRYCGLGMQRAQRQHDLVWRQGIRSLVSGSVLFATGIALSYVFTQPWVGELARDLFGDGVFLVVAWVGLWYPLDILFIARDQANREISVFNTMVAMPVVVRTHHSDAPIATLPGAPTTSSSSGSRSLRLRGSRVRLRGAASTGTPGAS